MSEWSEKKAWWLDLLKFGITFTLGAFITLVVINRIEEHRAIRRSYTQINDQLKLTALEDFRKHTYKYSEAALDAYVDLKHWRQGDPKTSSMLRYEQEAHDDYLIAVEELRRRFEDDVLDLKKQIDALESVGDEMFTIYDRFKKDMETNGNYGAEGLDNKRPKFNELKGNFSVLRKKIIRDVGGYVLTDR
jgi:hypothetical protein